MTNIMDYKEKYKEALARAKKLSIDGYLDAIAIDEIFPELRESEDERVRKMLRAYIHDFGVPKEYFGDVETSDVLAWLEKQGTQPADKIERKFKVGDWIVQENIGVYKVIEICESWYEVVDNKDNHYSISFDKEYMCHLWTIEDTSAGDVLAFDDNTIVIFKDLYNATIFHSYCHFEDGLFNVSEDEAPHGWEGKGFYPATKEQRDLLFTKMKEAGYEWDADKKELKKIEVTSKESENEKVRQEIRNFIWEYPDKLPERDKWLAWLEKQGKRLDADKVIKWLDEHVPTKFEDMQNYIENFRKAMKGD